ncbi:MAG: PAS domain S-box protein [Desulfobacteraceae bacterium]|nr:PAS domain S-box protein [Desulfobacteraceae bacterium]
MVVNRNNDIIYIHGRVGKYLEPAPGTASLNIMNMARHGLKNSLASAVSQAHSRKQNIAHEGLRVKSNGSYIIVNLTVMPATEPLNLQGFLIVMFEEAEPAKDKKPDETKQSSLKDALERTSELEYELSSTKENLQSTIEELEASNEELKSTNEELQSTNEELQSTNEELETSKEEMQSLNEETETVNAELQSRIDALSKANDDIKNLLDSTEIATIFLDRDMCITRFTPKVTDIISLIQSDVGRPFSHFASNLKYENIAGCAENVLKTLVFMESEVEDTNGKWYFMRIIPYRTITDMINGVVITFQNISEKKHAEDALRESEGKWRAITEYSPYYIMTLDKEGNVQFVNRAIQGLSKEEITGSSIFNYVSEKYREVMEKNFEHVWETGEYGQYEAEYIGPDGAVGLFETLVWPAMQQGQITALTISAREISKV